VELLSINGWEFVLLAVIAVIVLGPERLPEYVAKLRGLIRQARAMADSARGQLREQMGPEFDDIDWQQFDPRQYDPRRIVREALSDVMDPDDPLGLKDKPVSNGGPVARAGFAALGDRPAPYDTEAT